MRIADARAAAARMPALPFEPREVFLVGDVHSDLEVVLAALAATRAVAFREPVQTLLAALREMPHRPFRERQARLEGALSWCPYAKPETAIVFLGDLIDGFRAGQREHMRVRVRPAAAARGAAGARAPRGVEIVGGGVRRKVVTLAGPSAALAAVGVGARLPGGLVITQASPPFRVGEIAQEERHIIALLAALHAQAAARGSAVVPLLGNHEAWVLAGGHGADDYATPFALLTLGGPARRRRLLAQALRAHPLHGAAVLRAGPWVCAHAGITPNFLAALARKGRALVDCNIFARGLVARAAGVASTQDATMRTLMDDDDSLWHTRALGDTHAVPTWPMVAALLKLLPAPARLMAFGHNVQSFRTRNELPQHLDLVEGHTHLGSRARVEGFGGVPRLARTGAPHGVCCFRVPGGNPARRRGEIYFCDTGPSTAFSFKAHDTRALRWARCPQVVCWRAADDSVTVRRVCGWTPVARTGSSSF